MNDLVIQAILVLLVLTALVMGGLSVKTWRAWHVVAGFLVFITACVFLVLLSMSLKARRVWLRERDRLLAQKERLERESQQLQYGDLGAVATVGDDLNSLSNRLHRLSITQGRVWRGCQPEQPAADGTITLTIPGADATNPHQIPGNSVVYVFREVDSPEGWKIPVTYVGEFFVESVTEATVRLRETVRGPSLWTANRDVIGQLAGGATWSIHEILPPDDHFLFTDAEQPIDWTAPGEPIFGQPNRTEVEQVLQTVLQYSPVQFSPQAVQSIVDNYLRDGARAEPTDPPEAQFAKVEFVQPYQEKVDSETAQSVLSSSFFDPQGLAQPAFVRRGDDGTVRMPAGAIAILPRAQAEQLMNNGTCRLIEPIYVRSLTDFTFAFRNYFNRLLDLQRQIALLNYNLNKLRQTRDAITQVIGAKQDERAKLQSDLRQVQQERDFLAELVTTVQQQKEDLLAEMSRLFRANIYFRNELDEIQRAVFQRAEQAAQQAAVQP